MPKSTKKAVEISLVSAELTGLPERKLPHSRNLGSIDLVWPRTGVACKTAAREMRFKKGKVDFASEPWAKRIVYREEIEFHWLDGVAAGDVSAGLLCLALGGTDRRGAVEHGH